MDYLIDMEKKMYEGIMDAFALNMEVREAQFQYIDGRLDLIDGKLDEILQIIKRHRDNAEYFRTPAIENLQTCYGFQVAYEHDFPDGFRKYSDLRSMYADDPNACNTCLNSISIILNQEEANTKIYFKYSDVKYSELVEGVYRPTRDLFLSVYQEDFDILHKAFKTSLYPIKNLSNQLAVSYEVDRYLNFNERVIPSLERSVRNEYNNPYMVVDFANNFYDFYPYFEFLDENNSSNTFQPYEISDLALKQDIIEGRNDNLTRDVKFIIEKLEETIIQQSFVSGNMLIGPMKNYLQDKSSIHYPLCKKVLSNNYLLAQNFAAFIIHDALKDTEEDSQGWKQYHNLFHTPIKIDPNKLIKLDKLISPYYAFDLSFKEINGVLIMKVDGIDIPAPSPALVFSNIMVYPDNFVQLVNLREDYINLEMDLLWPILLPDVTNNPEGEINWRHYKHVIFESTVVELYGDYNTGFEKTEASLGEYHSGANQCYFGGIQPSGQVQRVESE